MRAVAVVFAGLFMGCASDATRIAQSENRCGTSQSPNQWIDVKQDTLVAFDGQTLHFWHFQHGYVRSWGLPMGAQGGFTKISRVYWDSSGPLFTVDHSPPMQSYENIHGKLEVLRADSAGAHSIVGFESLLWPRDKSGWLASGFSEASPSVDIRDGCVVFSDGHTNRLIVTDLRSNLSDTMDRPLPERFASDDPSRYKALGVSEGEFPVRYPGRILASRWIHQECCRCAPPRPNLEVKYGVLNFPHELFALMRHGSFRNDLMQSTEA
jgi:hypothetical protein